VLVVKAVWNGAVVAQSGGTVVVEGQASYYTLTVDGRTNPDAAWVYRSPSPAAAGIAGYIAFRRGVQVVDDDT
jgi:uncharacterized protein (DUF427 family)